MAGDDARPHSIECRARLEELMRGDDVEAEINSQERRQKGAGSERW